MSQHFKVSAMIQGADIDNNEPVQVQWYNGADALQAGSALLSAFAHGQQTDTDPNIPDVARYRTLSVQVTIIEVPEV